MSTMASTGYAIDPGNIDDKKRDLRNDHFTIAHNITNPLVMIIGIKNYGSKWRPLPGVATDI